MPDTAQTLADTIRRSHELMLKVTEELDLDELTRRPSDTAPPIAFHLWHMARWADRVQSSTPAMTASLEQRLGPGRELWAAENLASSWGLDERKLGRAGTGLGMSDDDAAGIAYPGKSALLDYARRSFAAMERAANAVEEGDLNQVGKDANGRETTVTGLLLGHITHISRHLGMIEGIRGTRGMRGSATA
jgi:hypothetical protein